MGNVNILGSSIGGGNSGSEFYNETAIANMISGSYSASTALIARGSTAKAICVNFITNDSTTNDLIIKIYSSSTTADYKSITLKAGESLTDLRTACYGLAIEGTSVTARVLIQQFS